MLPSAYHEPDRPLGQGGEAEVNPAQVPLLHEVGGGEEVDVDEAHVLAHLEGGVGRGEEGSRRVDLGR